MQTRTLGTSGLEVSAMGLGLMGMSQSYGTPEERDERESIATIHRAIELGVTFFDTAEVYGPFTNEELLARALPGKRDRVDHRDQVRLQDRERRHRRHGQPAASTSARRWRARSAVLRPTTSISFTSTASTLRCPSKTSSATMADLVREGKVRFLGLSEAGEQTIRRAHAVHPIAALQSEYSLWERNLEPRIIPLLARARHRPRAVRAARPRIPHWCGEARRGISGGGLSSQRPALPGRELRRQRAGRDGCARDGRAQGADAVANRARLAAAQGSGRRADPRDQAAALSRRECQQR